MDKITKEELMKKLNLTEEELEKVAGGLEIPACQECIDTCLSNVIYASVDCYRMCSSNCLDL